MVCAPAHRQGRADVVKAHDAAPAARRWPMGVFMRIRSIVLNAGVALVLAASPAFACKGKNTLFSDDFREVDESWGVDAAAVSVDGGRVVIKPDASRAYKILYPTTSFDSFDFCVSVRMPNNVHVTNPTGDATAGLIFWASDYSNFFIFEISANGQVGVQRQAKSKYSTILAWRAVDGVNTGPGAKNRLRVTASGNTLTFMVNDTKVGSIKAPQPDGAGQIGIRAQSEKDRRDAWKYFDLVVTDVAK